MTTTRLRRRRLASALAAAAALSTLTACGTADSGTEVAAAPSASAAAPTVGEFCASIMAIDTASSQMDGGGEEEESVDPAASPSASAVSSATPSAPAAAATTPPVAPSDASATPAASPAFTASSLQGDLPVPDGSAAPAAETPPAGTGTDSGPASGSGSAEGGDKPSAEEIAEMGKTFNPLLDEIERTKPAAVGAEVDTLLRLARQAFSTGNFDLFDSPEFRSADIKVDTFMDAECGYQKMSVTASDFEYAGIPDTAKAGPTGIKLVNEGKELHHIVLLRMNDGVTLTADELVALPEAEARTKATPAGEVFAVPGASDTAFFDLKPGRYAAVCFIPKGSKGGQQGDGPPHFVEGMIDEITVS